MPEFMSSSSSSGSGSSSSGSGSSSSGSGSSSSAKQWWPWLPSCDDECYCPGGNFPFIRGSEAGGGGTDPRDGSAQIPFDGNIPKPPISNGPKVNVGLNYCSLPPIGGNNNSTKHGGGWTCGTTAGLNGPIAGDPAAPPKITRRKSARNEVGCGLPPAPLPPEDPQVYICHGFTRDEVTQQPPVMPGGPPTYDWFEVTGDSMKYDSGGLLQSFKDAGGNTGSLTYSGETLSQIDVPLGSQSNSYIYGWSGDKTSEVIYKVNDREVTKTTYGYVGDNLVTIKVWENSVEGIGTPDWGVVPISATFYTYYPDTSRIRHVIPPKVYRQMANNGIEPEFATESQLNEYAATEFEYGIGGKVSVMFTTGRLYRYAFTYTYRTVIGSSYNSWQLRTDVEQPDGSLKRYYYNQVGELMLSVVEDSATAPTRTWYPLYQKFENVSGRIVLSAGGSAIAEVDESDAGLVTLNATDCRINEFTYDSNGNRNKTIIRNGTGSPQIILSAQTYEARPVSGQGTRYVTKTNAVSRYFGHPLIVTQYDYTWHGSTFQPETITTKYPKVRPDENGTDADYTSVSHYNELGAMVESVDQLGVRTTYEYDAARGGMTKMIQDAASGGLQLVTDYVLDDRGRTVLTLGPVHEVDLDGTPTALRTANWTYYNDAEDGTWSFSGYRTTTGPSVDQIVGPVTIMRPNLPPPADMIQYDGWRQSSMIHVVYTGLNIPAKDHVFERADWLRWTVQMSNVATQLKEKWTYFVIPEEGYGFQSVNYGKKLFGYDNVGRQSWTMCPGGTIDKITYNEMGLPVLEELGTTSGLTVTSISEYNPDGNLAKKTVPVDDSPDNDRVTEMFYDWRNRLEKALKTVQQDAEGSGSWTYTTIYKYDDFDNVREVAQYEGAIESSIRVSLNAAGFDVLGRQFISTVHGVDGESAGVGMVSRFYYDAVGRVVRNAPAGTTLLTATVYDAVGRTVKSFQAWPTTGDTPSAAPASVSHSVVMEQQEMKWDKASNLLSIIAKQRFDNAFDTQVGELGNPGSSSPVPKARASYFASYSDALGRTVARANYGTNGGVAWSRSETIPLASDTILVSSTFYNGAGNATRSTDAAGIVNTKVFDNADRLITTIENDAETGSRTTHYEYTDDAWLRKLISQNPVTGTQITEWLRGVTPSQGSALYSNRLVYQKIYPDSVNGGDRVTYLYNRQLEATSMTDQAGTSHEYFYDKMGRLLTDTVTAFGADIETTVSKLETTYNRKGFVATAVSKEVGGGVINQVINSAYTPFNQLSTQFQEHTGSFDPDDSLKVVYDYANGTLGFIRLTTLNYPKRTGDPADPINYTYDSGTASALNRISRLRQGGDDLSTWRYLGLGTVVGQKYNRAADTELTMQNGGTGDAGDPYTGLDRFGRLVETIWKSGSNELVHSRYGRNRVGRVEWRRDVKAHSFTPEVKTQDNYYRYDGLQQVTRHDRGDLVPSSGPGYTSIDPITRQQEEIFTFDETGNWMTDYNAASSLSQSRTQNAANEITALAQVPSAVQPTYDLAGNMRTVPQPSNWEQGYDLKWDAWNRLVEIKAGGVVVASYSYDALTRRIVTTTTSGDRHYYYDNQWRVLEERVNSGSTTTIDRQYLWGLFDRWNLIRRKRTTSSLFDETRWVLKDYLDPVALVKIVSSAAVVDERYGYDAFGAVNLMTASFAPRASSVCDWNFLFHAEFKDLETGLYNYGYRYYHPELGRWLSRDPIGEVGGLNLYAFVGNRAITKIDFIGLIYNKSQIKPPSKPNEPCYDYYDMLLIPQTYLISNDDRQSKPAPPPAPTWLQKWKKRLFDNPPKVEEGQIPLPPPKMVPLDDDAGGPVIPPRMPDIPVQPDGLDDIPSIIDPAETGEIPNMKPGDYDSHINPNIG